MLHNLRIRLFGRFSVFLNERPINGLYANKLQELLSYLLVHRDSPHARETLATLLWGDNSTAQSKKYLRQALWQLQSALESRDEKSRRRALNVEPDWVCLNKDADIWLDLEVFEQAFARAREVAGQHLDATSAAALEAAVQLYQGDLLEGWYQDWCVCERERLQTNYLIMLDKLMSYCEIKQRYETGLTYGLTVLRYDRARESTHRRLMRLYYLAGDRTGALRQYEHCVAALKEELGVKPSRLTASLYEQMRLDEFHSPVVAPEGKRDVDPTVLPRVVEHLKQLRCKLKEIHGQVQQDIKTVDAALDEWR
ncbi:MAG: BTAD domain-containing putative transcriptional regulator [Acidobacteriota bacterium]